MSCSRGERRAFLRDDQQAGGLAVEAVGEFEHAQLRALHAQLLDHAVAHPAAAMNRLAGRLVDDEQRVILIHHRQRLARRRGCGVGSARRCGSEECAPRRLPAGGRSAAPGPCSPAPRRCAGCDRCGSWVPLGDAQEVVVDALARRRLVDAFVPNRDRFAFNRRHEIYFRAVEPVAATQVRRVSSPSGRNTCSGRRAQTAGKEP
jgi:hypothetical protein